MNGIVNKSFGANGHAIFTDLKEVPPSATTEEDGEILSKLGSHSYKHYNRQTTSTYLLTPRLVIDTGSATDSNCPFQILGAVHMVRLGLRFYRNK